MTVRIRRQIQNADGTALAGATVTVYEVGQSGAVSTHVSDADGIIDLELADVQGTRSNVKYDVKVEFSGNVWWIRGLDEAQLSSLDVKDYFRLPKYTTTERDALTLAASDAGTVIYNTTTAQVETWDGTGWDVAQISELPTATPVTTDFLPFSRDGVNSKTAISTVLGLGESSLTQLAKQTAVSNATWTTMVTSASVDDDALLYVAGYSSLDNCPGGVIPKSEIGSETDGYKVGDVGTDEINVRSDSGNIQVRGSTSSNVSPTWTFCLWEL